MAYDNQCGSCGYFKEVNEINKLYNKDNPSNIKGYCEWYKAYYYPDDSCGHHRDRDYVPGGCFITTVVCEKLGYDDHSEVLESLREFRRKVLQQDVSYAPILYQYDIIGPSISQKLRNDSLDISQNIYKCLLLPIVGLLKKDEYKKAVEKYMFMTNCLKDYYGIDEYPKINPSYDYKNGGHGYIKKTS